LRDSYRRALKHAVTKSGQKSKFIKKWKYEDEMQFLKTHLKERETISNVGIVSDEDEDSFEPDKGPEEEYQPQHQDTEPVIDNNTDIFDSQSSPNTSVNQSTSKDFRKKTALPKKNVSNSSESASSTLMKYILEKKDEEQLEEKKKESSAMDQFFLSMCSTVKQFSPYNQHLAKTKIFSIVSEIELDSLRQTQQQPLFQPIPLSTSNFNLQSGMHVEDFQISPGQHQQDYHQPSNHRYTPQQHSENDQEASNTSSATTFFQNFQAGADRN